MRYQDSALSAILVPRLVDKKKWARDMHKHLSFQYNPLKPLSLSLSTSLTRWIQVDGCVQVVPYRWRYLFRGRVGRLLQRLFRQGLGQRLTCHDGRSC